MFTKRKQRRMNMTHNEVRENLFQELWQLEFNLVYEQNSLPYTSTNSNETHNEWARGYATNCADTLCSDFEDAPNNELQKLIDEYNKEN